MMDITLEKVEQIRDRVDVSYEVAKNALEENNGNVLDALIYLEKLNGPIQNEKTCETNSCTTVEEFKDWIKNLIEKGNISRIKIKKEDTVLVDVPVNAGISAMVIAVVLPPVLAFGVIAAVATKITIEITKADGSVEVVNKYVKKATEEVKGRAIKMATDVKEKATKAAQDVKGKIKDSKAEHPGKVYTGEDTVYTYTVNFDD